MALSGSAGWSNTKEDFESEEFQTNYGEKYGIKESATTGTVANSGSKNTSNQTSVNSGSVNTSNSSTSAQENISKIGESSSTTYNSGRVDTSQLMLTEDAVNHLVKGMMERTDGLAATVSGQNASGGYNSTVTAMLASDLTSRIAGDVAARSAKTVNTIGPSWSSTTNSGRTDSQVIGGTTTNATQNIGSSISSVDASQIIGGSTQTSNVKSTDEMAEAAIGNAEIIKSGESEKTTKEAKVEMGWIVCTELVEQDRMPKRFYVPGLRAFQGYSPAIQKGYYYWARPALTHLKSDPYSPLSMFLDDMLNARAEYLAAEAKVQGAKKTVLGWIAKQLVWGCWLLGKTVARNVEYRKE